MPTGHELLLFVLAGWLLNLAPGPDVLYIVSHSLRGGARAGLVAGLGITAGCCLHATAAALGLGSLLAASTTAFTLVKWTGAGYLCWIGVRALLAPRPGGGEASLGKAATAVPAAAAAPPSLRKVFTGGFLTNALNPKVAIFFLAFVPQFIAADATHKGWVFLALGLLFNLDSVPINAGWALAAAWLARRDAVRRGMRWLDKAAGVMFLGFGVKLALAHEPAH